MTLFQNRVAGIIAGPLVLGVISACGGGSVGVDIADGGIRGTGSSVGPVSGFGSVFVNGVEFFTDEILNQRVDSNDGVETEGDLQEGMILRVNGEWQPDGTGTAESMEYDDSLRGTVSNPVLDVAGERLDFTIHNQPVFADLQTVFKGTTFTTLASGEFVRVSAWRQADGGYRASFVGAAPASIGADPVEVEGPVDANSAQSGQFTMNGLVIEYDTTDFGEGLSSSDLTEGRYLEVEGGMVGGVLVATQIQQDDFRRYQADGEDIELSGPVSSSYDPADESFTLNGLTIVVTDSTEFDQVTREGLVEGLLVQVEGDFVSGSVVQATEIELREGNAEIKGPIDPGTLPAEGQFEVGGVIVRTTSSTTITDDESESRLTLTDLVSSAGTVLVEVAGLERQDGSGTTYIDAIKIESEGPDDGVDSSFELAGELQAIDGFSITVLGVKMDANDGAFDGVSRTSLQNLLASGAPVYIEVVYTTSSVGTGYVATEIELEE
ncbi:hypothetical protein BKP64_00325 [Marinobacter salinus]|uniref:DUF5666 domain-containing protein n=1 Tax=Marinobacter salinus TaxID=1874317 RepID=A0A1D9GGT1_9GAMM|nr:DUF5666 domain-containing protein [Marinobacter salinus]AOY86744.1 hypothetical protein BKP64_00325 [Marinobacter salinus]